MNDLVFREGTYYKKFSEVPFTGQVEGQNQGSLKNGKQEGYWVTYHDNGQLLNKGDYKNGSQEGSWVSYHDNGQLMYKGDYKNGRLDGSWMGYFNDGSVLTAITGTFKDGAKISD